MALIPLETTVGDLGTSLFMQLRNKDGTFPDLSGIPLTDIDVHLKNRESKITTVRDTTFVVAATTGRIRYDPVAADVPDARVYDIEVKVLFSSGKTVTYPVCEKWEWKVIGGLV